MKKILLILMSVLLFIPVVVNAATCEPSKVYIDSISIDKNSNVNEIEETYAQGKTINIALGMSEVGDNIRYKIIVKNDSKEDYILNKNSFKAISKYIDYSLDTDNSDIIKANSSKELYLNIQYKNKVPEDVYNDDSYSDVVSMKLDLSSDNNILNPETGIKYYLIVALIVIVCGILSLMFRKNKHIVNTIIIIGIILIPMSVNALCKFQIELNSSVKIEKEKFTGTIFRSSNTLLGNGDFIDQKYLICNRGLTCSYVDENEYNSKELYIKHEVVNNQIISSYVCNDTVCYKGATTTDFDENKQAFLSNPYYEHQLDQITDGRIYNDGTHDYIESNGNVRISSGCGHCTVTFEGLSICESLDMPMC